MKSIVVFIEHIGLTSEFAKQLSSNVEQDDVLTIIYQLPKVKHDAMPLIGDLRELRLEKAKRQLVNWFENNKFPVLKFNPFVIDEQITSDYLKLRLNGDERFLILYEKHQLNNLKDLFNKPLKNREVEFKEL